MLLLNKHNLAIAAICSKEDSRYNVNAVHITPAHTEATDGHRLVRVSLPEQSNSMMYPCVAGFTPNGSPESFLLPRKAALEIGKAIPKSPGIPILAHVAVTTEAEGCAFAVTDLDSPQVYRPKPTTGRFPSNAGSVLKPLTPPVFQITVSASYLAEMAKLAQSFAGEAASDAVTLTFYGKDKQMLMHRTAGDGQQWEGALMPMRGDNNKAPEMSTARRSTDKAVE